MRYFRLCSLCAEPRLGLRQGKLIVTVQGRSEVWNADERTIALGLPARQSRVLLRCGVLAMSYDVAARVLAHATSRELSLAYEVLRPLKYECI